MLWNLPRQHSVLLLLAKTLQPGLLLAMLHLNVAKQGTSLPVAGLAASLCRPAPTPHLFL
jgi:hypothetical protein